MNAILSRGPLSGYKILDLSSVVMGPFATQILGDFGAHVIAIEPIAGARNRHMGTGPHPELSGIALNLLRNKRAVALDMKDSVARDAVLAIGRTCDAVVTNLRPRALSHLRLNYTDFQAVRSDIIYCQAQGFRTDQPRGNEPAYDDIIQAECGIADAAFQISGTPQIAPTIIADKVCGLAIVNAVLAALLHRERTGCGQRVEVPMLDVMRSFMLVEHGASAIYDDDAPAGYARVLNPERGPQKSRDGWINILPYSSEAFDVFFGLNGRPDLVGDPRSREGLIATNARALYAEMKPIIANRTTEDWLAFCCEHDIPVGAVARLDDLVRALPRSEHPVVGPYRVTPAPIWFTGCGPQDPLPARRIGEDTREVLAEAGVSRATIDDMFVRGVAAETVSA